MYSVIAYREDMEPQVIGIHQQHAPARVQAKDLELVYQGDGYIEVAIIRSQMLGPIQETFRRRLGYAIGYATTGIFDDLQPVYKSAYMDLLLHEKHTVLSEQ